MTAATNEHFQAVERARPTRSRHERLLHLAATAPRPLRIFFEAEVGYRRWRPSAKARAAAALAGARHSMSRETLVAADGSVRLRPRLAMSADVQLRVARRLVPLTVVLTVVGLAGTNMRTGGDAIVVEHVGAGGVQTEALGAPVDAGIGASKGVATKGVAKGVATDSAATDSAATGAGPTSAAPPPQAAETAPAVPVPPPADRTIPAQRGALPVGKGMWIWLADQAEGGNAQAIVARAQEVGLTHLYVRTASLDQGFYAGPFLDQLLPAAHAASIRVYAWDFPYLDNVDGDVARAVQAITYLTPDGHRVDGYAADIELQSMGVNINPQTGKHFGVALRRAVGPNYPLIACVPRPSPALKQFPFADLVASFDAIAPMVYWLGQDPINHIAGAVRDLEGLGKPILPVGQAYDGGGEGGPPGVPPRDELIQFMQSGDKVGAAGVSWWSWQHADQEAWDAIKDAAEFRLPVGDPASFTPGQVNAYQTLLTSLGFPTPSGGTWSKATTAAVKDYQRAARVPPTGVIDDTTRKILLTPFAPPIQPQP